MTEPGASSRPVDPNYPGGIDAFFTQDVAWACECGHDASVCGACGCGTAQIDSEQAIAQFHAARCRHVQQQEAKSSEQEIDKIAVSGRKMRVYVAQLLLRLI